MFLTTAQLCGESDFFPPPPAHPSLSVAGKQAEG